MILNNMGFVAIKAQLLTGPPSLCAFIFAITCAYILDRMKRHGIWIIIPLWLTVVGFFILGPIQIPVKFVIVFDIECRRCWRKTGRIEGYCFNGAQEWNMGMRCGYDGGVGSILLACNPTRFTRLKGLECFQLSFSKVKMSKYLRGWAILFLLWRALMYSSNQLIIVPCSPVLMFPPPRHLLDKAHRCRSPSQIEGER